MNYKPQLVTFFDILGFRGLVEGHEASEIFRILKKLRSSATPDTELKKIYEISTVAFSDSIVRSVHILGKSNVQHPSGILFYELSDLADIQAKLIYEDGVFLRGGITAGHLYSRGGIVFGPGLVQSYELESKQAIYPRILVDGTLFELFKQAKQFLGAKHHDIKTDMAYIESIAPEDADGKRFIDYLGSCHNEIDGDLAFLDVLDRHKERVIEKVSLNTESPRVLEKYRWVASYHNSVVGRYPEDFFEDHESSKSVFLLTDNDVPGLSGWKLVSE